MIKVQHIQPTETPRVPKKICFAKLPIGASFVYGGAFPYNKDESDTDEEIYIKISNGKDNNSVAISHDGYVRLSAFNLTNLWHFYESEINVKVCRNNSKTLK